MSGAPARRLLPPLALLALGGVAVRLWDVLHYPADWGFDASFNWQYIVHLTRSWALPPPDAGWSAGDAPLYFYLAAAVLRGARWITVDYYPLVTVPLLSVAAGLGVAALAAALVRRLDPTAHTRVWLAAGLVLVLPAHVQMSVMVNEEIFAALFTSLALYGLCTRGAGGLRRALWVGGVCGLALLTKLSGATIAAAAAATWALDGLRGRDLRGGAARVGLVVLMTALVGGWFYLRNRIEYGYFQPFGMPAHRVMFSMPPGERSAGDYLRVPLATWSDPQVLHPDLLRSVWGSTYATLWFDGHRFFLPDADPWVRRLGTATLLLALLPSAAFGAGLARGAARIRRGIGRADLPLCLLTALTLAGYVLYTWRNPWFVAVKGTTLLGLSLPFAVYASESLARWTRGRAAPLVWALLAALAVCATLASTYNLVFERTEVSGLHWEPPS